MFSSLKFTTLRSRARQKEMSLSSECNGTPEERIEDDDEEEVGCAPLKCQQQFGKCTAEKTHVKHSNKSKRSNSCGTTPVKKQAQQQTDPCIYNDANLSSYATGSNDDVSLCVTSKTIDVHIERDDDGSLGLTLQGGSNHNPELSRPLVVTYVKPDGPTNKEGTIQMGDRLLAVDGFPLNKVTLNEAYNILRNGDCRMSRLTVEYDITNMRRFSGPLLVEMESLHPHQLGLTLTNTPHNAAVLIDEIKAASIAERCGALFPGDQILSVNDTRIEGSRMPATEVYKLLRICGGAHTNLLLQILPANAFIRSQTGTCKPSVKSFYWPKKEVAFNSNVFSSNYYDVPNEYIVPPAALLTNRPTIDLDKTDKLKLMTVTLHSDDKLGYGLSVYFCPGTNSATISFITPEGPADLCEILQFNDRILSINQMPIITGIGSEPQALHKIPGVTLGKVELLVEYDIQHTYICGNQGNVFIVELIRYNKKNLGITVTGNNDYMQVSEIKTGSVADRCGVLSVGDKILSINGRTLNECTVQEASSILHSHTETIILEVEKLEKGEDVSETTDECVEYTVQLNKQNGPIGIIISGSDSYPKEIIISALTPGGLAEKTGALHIGDRVLEINNEDVRNTLLSHATVLLHNAYDKVLLKVLRNSQHYARQYTDERKQRIYGSPGVISDDSAVESWESSTHRDVSPNRITSINVPQCSRKKPPECGTNDVNGNGTVCDYNNSSSSLEPVYSNIPFRRDSRPVYYDKLSTSMDIHNELNEAQRYYTEKIYENKEYRRYGDRYRNIDDIFNIADLQEYQETNENADEIYQVILFKDRLYEDFGFSISDGLYERGVFLNRIRQGGPAEKIGLLRPFDRIIQVNNVNTEDFDCCLTVPLIASAGDRITLTVKRKKVNASFENQIQPYLRTQNTRKEHTEDVSQQHLLETTNTK